MPMFKRGVAIPSSNICLLESENSLAPLVTVPPNAAKPAVFSATMPANSSRVNLDCAALFLRSRMLLLKAAPL